MAGVLTRWTNLVPLHHSGRKGFLAQRVFDVGFGRHSFQATGGPLILSQQH